MVCIHTKDGVGARSAQAYPNRLMTVMYNSTMVTRANPAHAFLKTLCLLLLCTASFLSRPAIAQLTIEITGGGASRIPVAIAPFAGDGLLPQALVGVVRADLERSGLFRMVETAGISPAPTDSQPVIFGEWKSRAADALAVGSVSATADGRYEVRFRLYDVVKQVQFAAVAYTMAATQMRTTAHRIADTIYEKLTGERGVFGTRIAFVVKQGQRFELQIADADGAGPQTALVSREPIISPAWSPDGTRIAYVSFENKKPVVYIHSLVTGNRTVLANYKGSNSAPAWAPDGNRLAVVLSRDGGSQIFTLKPDGSDLKRLTTTTAIDTEPFYSPDGQFIYFTSDRGGGPQIYRMPATGGEAARVTFDGGYNVTPRVCPDGRSLAYIARNGGRFQLMLLDLGSQQTQPLTDGSVDESPAFSPNGKTILYATEVGGRGYLSAVSSDGRVRQRLSVQAGDVREPTWGPYN
jgi:TolB protein